MTELKLALDWTPNINHIGFFVAREQGYYRDRKLDVTIIDPTTDNYATTPAKKVEIGKADLALCPLESIISYRTKVSPFRLTAIAALLQEDLSAIAVKKNSHITRPKHLDGKIYASYKARYEDAIVTQMILHDGGVGELRLEHPSKLGIWDRIVNGTYDATWIFTNWEGVEAEGKDLELTYFRMKDFGIPYSYSPVIAASEEALRENRTGYVDFLAATKAGYLFALENPGEALSILKRYLPERDKDISLKKAHAATAPHFGNPNNWGKMDEVKVTEFLTWIHAHGLEDHHLTAAQLITNDLLT